MTRLRALAYALAGVPILMAVLVLAAPLSNGR
jgi:hypothetical protein